MSLCSGPGWKGAALSGYAYTLGAAGNRTGGLAHPLNALAVPQIRGGLELNTKLADIVLLQFVRGDLGLFDLSYVSLLGLGQTGWLIHEKKSVPRS